MEAIVSRCAALDVHKGTVMGCVRFPDEHGGRVQEDREFRTFTAGLRALWEWLAGYGVTQVAMEATGVYWKPVWHVLEAEPTWELLLTNAQHVKNLPGRKTDLLTELADSSRRGCVRRRVRLARFAAREQRLGCAAGVVRAGGAAAGLA